MARYDQQTKAVYGWEDQWRSWGWATFTTLHRPRKIIRWLCRLYRVPAPVVRWNTSKGKPYPDYCPETHVIRIAPHSNNAVLAIHETAHAIHDWLLGSEGEPHSKEFVGIYLWCLIRRKVAPRSALLASLAETKTSYVNPSRMSPKAVRARYQKRIRDAAELRAQDAA